MCKQEQDELRRLLLAIKRGDLTSLEKLWNVYRPFLLEFAIQKFGEVLDYEEVDSVVTDVLLTLPIRTTTYSSEKFPNAYGWICRVLVNALLDAVRAKARRFEKESNYRLPSSAGDLSEQQRDAILSALGELGDADRTALEMHARGSTFAEIAEVLDVSTVAARQRNFRAMRKLKRLLEKHQKLFQKADCDEK